MISQALRAGVIFFSPPQPLHHLCTKPLPVKHPATIQDGGIELIQRSVFRSKITPALQASGDGDNRICSANHFYENYLQYFCTTKVIFIILIYKLTKNLPINSPVQRKIPAKNVLVDCIHVNMLPTACQSEGKSFFSGQNEKPCFLRHNFIFFSIFFIDERSCLEQFIYQKIKISRKWSV